METPKFDVLYKERGPSLDYHFCRGWDVDENGQERGCYGTNPDHGYTFDEAKEQIAKWHEQQAAYWRGLTLKEWGHLTPDEIESLKSCGERRE